MLLRSPLVAVLMVLGACQGVPEGARSGPAAVASETPALPDAPVYDVDADASEVRVLVYRGGPLARLGHNHVMTAPIHGEIRAGDTARGSGFHLVLRVEELQVDPLEARAEQGEAFSSEVSRQARDGTRHNMLGERLLDADNYPQIVIDSVALSGPRWNPDVTANVRLHDTTATLEFPAAVVAGGDELTVVARLPVTLSAFGIEPFTVLGGGLQVEDRLDVRVRVVARARNG